MSSEVKLDDAIKRPFSDMRKFVIGALLNIIPIINFFSIGYALEAAKLSLKKSRKLPEWDNWTDFFVNGLLAVIIILVWALPIIIISLIAAGRVIWEIIMNPRMLEARLFFGVLPWMVFAVMLGVLLWYLSPSILLSFVQGGDFTAGLKFKKIFKKAFHGEYFIGWISGAFVGLVMMIIADIIPVLRYVLVPAASFAYLIITFTLIGEVYDKI